MERTGTDRNGPERLKREEKRNGNGAFFLTRTVHLYSTYMYIACTNKCTWLYAYFDPNEIYSFAFLISIMHFLSSYYIMRLTML